MGTTGNTGAANGGSLIDTELHTLIKRQFGAARYIYGMLLMENGESDAVLTLLKRQQNGKYVSSHFDPDRIAFSRDRCLSEQVSEALASAIAMGLADYVLAIAEVGMHIGDEKACDEFRALVAKYGEEDSRVSDRISRCCSMTLYDLSGVVARGFASEENCVHTFFRWDNLESLFTDMMEESSECLSGQTSAIEEMDKLKWVYIDESRDAANVENPHGPLQHWTESVYATLEKLTGFSKDC